MIHIITLDREYGSGGAAIAKKTAERLGWTFWDQRLTREIARLAECDLATIARREERKDPLYYRLFKSFMRGSFEANLNLHRLKLIDSDRIVAITQQVVLCAAAAGNCVIVGRGSQYFLRDRADAYHVFIYAPYEEKLRRELQSGKSARQARDLIETVDRERAAFIKKYFAKDWPDHGRYHLMVNSVIGDDAAVETIAAGVQFSNKYAEANRE